ncbi:non-hydrolyzing UDP-N-acetylglucosamine 2-epimerase [Streptomyces pathocidini]|uniref:Non-hydrolyzing UDP-N-acetylglucosamine 2-epimerase n=1 Tax=Streptomyces pathocidini TaxID=1650571 RepID=A0ABW7ULG4_9ACTN|nr:UDP-N-acetylglucosamine 2-epimerase (non-hydrolyzing) [Streptomyces pathocidini]
MSEEVMGNHSDRQPTGGAAVVLGTRPEIIKLASVIHELGEDAWMIHTGQHYDPMLSDVFFESLGLPTPAYKLTDVGGTTRPQQFARMLQHLDRIFTERQPEVVIVQGDTNSVSAGAQAANYHGIPVVHVEAGLRSYDRAMPEEINRQVVAALADVHCAPTQVSARNLRASGVPDEAIHVTGNTVVEATLRALPDATAITSLLDRFGLTDDSYVLATIHRPSNTDDPQRLKAILEELAHLELPVLLPLHPRTAGRIRDFGLTEILGDLIVCPPLDYTDFLGLASRSRLIVSDSGGIQEECTVIKRPVIVLRDNTERPEAIETGFARLATPGIGMRNAIAALLRDETLHRNLRHRPSPFGDGNASIRIARLARNYMRVQAESTPQAA